MPGKCVESLTVCNIDVLNAGSPLGHNKECKGEEGSRVYVCSAWHVKHKWKSWKQVLLNLAHNKKKHPNGGSPDQILDLIYHLEGIKF